jgi:histidinol-phosphate aminotransferase
MQAVNGDAVIRQQRFVESIRRGKTDLVTFLSACHWIEDVFESEANFILVRVADADGLVHWCAGNGIRIRNFSSQTQLHGCVRLTIGSPDEMAALKAAMLTYGERV